MRILAARICLPSFWFSRPSPSGGVALVVGNDSYDEVTGLKKAVSDAHALADALKPLGFEVERGRQRFEEHAVPPDGRFRAAGPAGRHGALLLAGHGVEIRGENYLLPTDVPKPEKARRAWCETAPFRPATSSLASRAAAPAASSRCSMPAATIPSSPASGPARLAGGTNGLAGMEAPEGVFVLLSAGARQEALDTLGDDDGSPNSIFTRALIKSLSTPGLSLVQIAKQTQTEVSTLAARSAMNRCRPIPTRSAATTCCCRLLLPHRPAPRPDRRQRLGRCCGLEEDRVARDRQRLRRLSRSVRAVRHFAEVARQRVAALTLGGEPPSATDQGGETQTAALSGDTPPASLP